MRLRRHQGEQEIRRNVKKGLLNLANGGDTVSNTIKIELQVWVSYNGRPGSSDGVV